MEESMCGVGGRATTAEKTICSTKNKCLGGFSSANKCGHEDAHSTYVTWLQGTPIIVWKDGHVKGLKPRQGKHLSYKM